MQSSFASCTDEGAADRRIETPYEGTPAATWDSVWRDGEPIDAPLALHRLTVPRSLTDYNRHLSESSYLLLIGDSADAFFRFIGIDEGYRAAGCSLYTAQTHLHHLGEAREGDELHLTLRVLDADERRLHVYHELLRGDDLLAAAEQLLVHVDTNTGRSAPMPPELHERVEAVRRAHAGLPAPRLLGKPLGIRRAAR